ncbi:DUF4153 domain-containing protein [Brevundimonas sp. 2R-24]|uniref:DUF4153 domain-containing protein n=1 Tax=Peiella sedimenti TaxID=3061083 RepID=A0ABT8SLN0_9CAUL|nr:DUF4153 domain-containing protein [Caulobacteraceae bacterium XZ-24]
MNEPAAAADERGRWILWTRLAVGLVQGLLLYFISRTLEPEVSRAEFLALMVVGFTPVVVLGGLGRVRTAGLIAWAAAAAAVVAGLSWYGLWRESEGGLSARIDLDNPLLPLALAVWLFIAHHLVIPALRNRRLVAPYPEYFDLAWKAAVQLALSLAFTGAVWLALLLGSALFHLIGLNFLRDLIQEPWFALPVTTVAFALGVALTDVSDRLIRGVRTIGLTLLSWLSPLLTLLAAGFLIAVPFAGIDKLWAAGSATALVLAAAAGLIILINAAYQDDTEETHPPMFLRWTLRVAAVLLVPLVLIAVWGLSLRIGQHGLTPERIIAACCALIGAVYAGGYAFAAVRPGAWMRPLEKTNVAAAWLVLAVILALFSPLADPARLSVADQTARLQRGAVSAADFDYAFLRFRSGRFGEAALARLTRSPNAEIARRAREAKAAEQPYDLGPIETEGLPVRLTPWPEGSAVPEGLIEALPGYMGNQCRASGDCLVQMRDLNGDGGAEALLITAHELSAWRQGPDGWDRALSYSKPMCGDEATADLRARLQEGGLATAPPLWPDLSLGGLRLRPNPIEPCDREPRGAPAEAVVAPPAP